MTCKIVADKLDTLKLIAPLARFPLLGRRKITFDRGSKKAIKAYGVFFPIVKKELYFGKKEYDLRHYGRLTLNNTTVSNSGFDLTPDASSNYRICLVGNHGVETIVVIDCQDNYDDALKISEQIAEFLALPITDFTCKKEIQIKIIDTLIKDLIKRKQPFFVNRTRAEDVVVAKMLKNSELSEYDYDTMYNNCGVYPKYDIEVLKSYTKEVVDAYKNTDIGCYHPVNSLPLFLYFIDNSTTVGSFENCSYPYKTTDDSWLNSLEDKKVLVVSAIPDTLELAYKTQNLKFKKFQQVVFYGAVQSIAGNEVHDSWVCSLDKMKNDIRKIDFDTALLSCGGYATPLGSFIKNLGKQAIVCGGGLQCWFNVYGDRWKDEEEGKDSMQVLNHEIPKNYKSVEGGCYW